MFPLLPPQTGSQLPEESRPCFRMLLWLAVRDILLVQVVYCPWVRLQQGCWDLAAAFAAAVSSVLRAAGRAGHQRGPLAPPLGTRKESAKVATADMVCKACRRGLKFCTPAGCGVQHGLVTQGCQLHHVTGWCSNWPDGWHASVKTWASRVMTAADAGRQASPSLPRQSLDGADRAYVMKEVLAWGIIA